MLGVFKTKQNKNTNKQNKNKQANKTKRNKKQKQKRKQQQQQQQQNNPLPYSEHALLWGTHTLLTPVPPFLYINSQPSEKGFFSTFGWNADLPSSPQAHFPLPGVAPPQ